MPLILLAHFLARILGFRHRDSEEFYRMFDVIGGFWLIVPIFAAQVLLSRLTRWLLPLPLQRGRRPAMAWHGRGPSAPGCRDAGAVTRAPGSGEYVCQGLLFELGSVCVPAAWSR